MEDCDRFVWIHDYLLKEYQESLANKVTSKILVRVLISQGQHALNFQGGGELTNKIERPID